MRANNANGDGKVRARSHGLVTDLYASRARSRVTNGKILLPNIDQRSVWVRRFRDINSLLIADAGGVDLLSEAGKALIRRATCLMVELERLEMLFALGDDELKPRKDQPREGRMSRLDAYQRGSNSLRRLLETL